MTETVNATVWPTCGVGSSTNLLMVKSASRALTVADAEWSPGVGSKVVLDTPAVFVMGVSEVTLADTSSVATVAFAIAPMLHTPVAEL